MTAHPGTRPDSSEPVRLDEATLLRWPLPMPEGEAGKEERGRILVIGGSRQMPGAVALAAEAALRAGAGKLQIATVAHVAALVAQRVPESRVVALPETPGGGLALSGLDEIGELAGRADAVLLGPGLQDDEASCAFAAQVLERLGTATVILDAAAMALVCRPEARPLERPAALTPHAGEMARLTGLDREAIAADPLGCAREAARRWNAVVTLKGAVTHVVRPDGSAWRHDGGSIGLGTSGSGDVLAGIIGGLAARGAAAEQACAWGVVLHARAGTRAAQASGPLGFLARELAAHVPALMHALGGTVGSG